jgi:hypothetical protein
VSDLLKFADRCEEVESGSFNLDKAILAALGFTWRGMAYWSREEKMWKGPTNFTTSIDAAMTLVPDGCSADTQQRKRIHSPPAVYIERAWAQIETLDGTEFIGNAVAVSLPLAICAAALRARSCSDVSGAAKP